MGDALPVGTAKLRQSGSTGGKGFNLEVPFACQYLCCDVTIFVLADFHFLASPPRDGFVPYSRAGRHAYCVALSLCMATSTLGLYRLSQRTVGLEQGTERELIIFHFDTVSASLVLWRAARDSDSGT